MIISPSILNCNFLNLEKELKKIKTADLIHLDIMDGHFVPNISFGMDISKQISNFPNIFFDIHLMISDPIKYIDKFIFKNTKYITIHSEIKNYKEVITYLKSKNVKVGISLNPNTPLDNILDILDKIDLVLVMSVEPGFGGQKFIEETHKKVSMLNDIRKNKNLNFLIEVDGGINFKIAKKLKLNGADSVVVGSFLFKQKNIKRAIDLFKKI